MQFIPYYCLALLLVLLAALLPGKADTHENRRLQEFAAIVKEHPAGMGFASP